MTRPLLTLPPVPAPFFYNGWILDWHDADTVYVKVDRGMRDYSTWSVRLAGSSARELSEPGGPEARAECLRCWPAGTAVVLATLKPDKYGTRKVASVVARHADDPDGDPVDVSWWLIDHLWAAVWSGRGAAPKPPWPRGI